MKIYTTKQFEKQYVKLRPSVKLQYRARVEVFKRDLFDPQLRNHTVKGKKYQGYRSIDVTGDVRALYTEREGGELVIFGFIGSHSQLYG